MPSSAINNKEKETWKLQSEILSEMYRTWYMKAQSEEQNTWYMKVIWKIQYNFADAKVN